LFSCIFSESWEQIEPLKQPIIMFFLSKKTNIWLLFSEFMWNTLYDTCIIICYILEYVTNSIQIFRRRCRDRMVFGFTTTCAIGAYHHWSCEFEPRSWRGVLDTTLCDKVRQRLATVRWYSPSSPVSSTNKTDP
jgi:hypothetical protein